MLSAVSFFVRDEDEDAEADLLAAFCALLDDFDIYILGIFFRIH
jgi:hypothetical protein